MTSHIALLHSVTIGGGRRLVMSDWRAMMEAIGLKHPRTLIATGNASFESERATIEQLEDRLELAFAQAFGRHVDTIVKTAAHWRGLTENNPFPQEAERNGTRVAVRVMRKPLDEAAIETLTPYATQGEHMKLVDGHLWIHFERDPLHSQLVPRLTTKHLGAGTVRGWSTVRRLNAMIAGKTSQ